MKRQVSLVCLLAIALLAGCSSGPHQLRRSWEDHVQQNYSEDSWVHGALLQDILPVYPLVGLVATVGDVLVVNPYYFWGDDAWDRKGTVFVHKSVTGVEQEKCVELPESFKSDDEK